MVYLCKHDSICQSVTCVTDSCGNSHYFTTLLLWQNLAFHHCISGDYQANTLLPFFWLLFNRKMWFLGIYIILRFCKLCLENGTNANESLTKGWQNLLQNGINR